MSMAYVYKCINKFDGTFYIGYREANKLAPELDLPIYRTSSKSVKKHFSDFEFEIISEFESGDDAYELEQRLIFENWNDPKLINRSCFHGTAKSFRRIGPHSESTKRRISEANRLHSHPQSKETREKISKSKTGITISDSHKAKIGDYHRGKVESEETRKKKSLAHIGKTHSDETKAKIAKGRSVKVVINGIEFQSKRVAAETLFPDNPDIRKINRLISDVLQP